MERSGAMAPHTPKGKHQPPPAAWKEQTPVSLTLVPSSHNTIVILGPVEECGGMILADVERLPAPEIHIATILPVQQFDAQRP